MFTPTFKPNHLTKFFSDLPTNKEFIFSEEVVEVMRAFERVSKTIWELKNKLNAYYSVLVPFWVEFQDDKAENVLVLSAENLTMFFYYFTPAQGEHMKQKGFHVAFLR